MTVKLSTLSVKIKTAISGSAGLSVVGSDYTAPSNTIQFQKTLGPYLQSVANSASLGADEMYSADTIIAAGGGFDFDLQNFTDCMNQAGASLVRVKTLIVRLLSVADDSTVGTNCSGITVNGPVPAPTVAAPVVSGSGGTLAAGTYYYKVTSTTAAGESTGSNEVSATTTGTTSEVTLSWGAIVDATGYKVYRGTAAGSENVLIDTISGGSTVTYTDTGGAGTGGSVPTTNTATVADINTLNNLLNDCVIGNGEIVSWSTPGAAGITVDSTHHILHFQNNDGSNTAALQLTVIGGSS